MSALAEMESDQMGERIRSVMSYKKDTGLVYCGNTPFGYDKLDGKLVPNKEEQALIQRMRALRKKKYSYDKIAQLFNLEGIISKTGSRFHATTIRKIILNDLHSGSTPTPDIPEPDGVLPMCVGVQSVDGVPFSNAIPYC
jgi:DNA invertase Pin-like site-specific DNA recombinase